MARTSRDVLEDHLRLRQQRELDADLRRNFAEDCVLLTTHGMFRGHDGVRRCAAILERELGRAHYNYRKLLVSGELGFLEWQAENGRGRVCDGADSYVVRDERIVLMTAHYTVQPKARVLRRRIASARPAA